MQTDHTRIDIEVLGVNDPVVIGTCHDIIQYIAKVSLETQTLFSLAKPQRGLGEALPEECNLAQGWNCTFDPPGCSKVDKPAGAVGQSDGCEDSKNDSYVCTNEDEFTAALQLLVYDPDRHSLSSKRHLYFVTVQVESGSVYVPATNVTILAEGSNASAGAGMDNSTSQNNSGIGRMDSRPQDSDPWDLVVNQTSRSTVLQSQSSMDARMQVEASGTVVKFFGTLEDVKRALATMRYRPDEDFEGTDTLQASVHDLDCCSSGATAFRSEDGSESPAGRRRAATNRFGTATRDNEESGSAALFVDGSVSLWIVVKPVDDPVQVCFELQYVGK
jgi:hypothetical protein